MSRSLTENSKALVRTVDYTLNIIYAAKLESHIFIWIRFSQFDRFWSDDAEIVVCSLSTTIKIANSIDVFICIRTTQWKYTRKYGFAEHILSWEQLQANRVSPLSFAMEGFILRITVFPHITGQISCFPLALNWNIRILHAFECVSIFVLSVFYYERIH